MIAFTFASARVPSISTGDHAATFLCGHVLPLHFGSSPPSREHFGGSNWALSRWGLETDISLYIGLITLVANLVVVVVVTTILKLFHASPNLDHTRPEDYLVDADVEGIDRLDDLLDGVPQRTGAHALR